jgi:hypothetical protein
MELLIILFTLGFVTIHAYEHKWIFKILHSKNTKDRAKAQNRFHFWANVMRFYYVGSVVFVGIILTFYLTIKLIPVMIITMLIGGHYFSWFLNKIRNLETYHIGTGWWDRTMSSNFMAYVSLIIVLVCSVWYFYN